VAPYAEERILAAAASISDGGRIDWDQLGAAADDPSLVEQLRIIDRIAQVHASRATWGSLTIIEPIGHGTFGTVYRAFDNDLHRDVALKVTTATTSASTPFDPDRLVREARLLARVRHPNVVVVYAAERKDDEVGVSMELIKGQTLDQIVRQQGPLSAREAALIGIDICRALAAVHSAGLLHGDIKAHNVMREDGGRIVLMDFGASRDITRTPGMAGDDFAGTPLYVAPEVFAGQPRSRASEIYSLGVLLYYIATGSYPIEGDTRTAITRQHASQTPPRHLRDARPDLPQAFIEVVEGALASDPADRYSSAGAFEAALNGTLGRSAASGGTRGWMAMAVGVVLIAALVGSGAYWRYSERTVSGASPSPTSTATTTAAATAPAAAAAAGAYDVGATMYRVSGGVPSPLHPGDRLRPGDQVYLQVRTSVPANVYVVNEDDRGESYLLFPLPKQEVQNPLPPGRDNHLPGLLGGREMYWQVTSAGGREHFLIFVSPEPLSAFEETFASLPLPSTGEPVLSARLTDRAVSTLRGVGGLVTAPNQPRTVSLSAQFQTPLPASSESTRGAWVRQITFANP
jgi:serine/threonine-protein kinase